MARPTHNTDLFLVLRIGVADTEERHDYYCRTERGEMREKTTFRMAREKQGALLSRAEVSVAGI